MDVDEFCKELEKRVSNIQSGIFLVLSIAWVYSTFSSWHYVYTHIPNQLFGVILSVISAAIVCAGGFFVLAFSISVMQNVYFLLPYTELKKLAKTCDINAYTEREMKALSVEQMNSIAIATISLGAIMNNTAHKTLAQIKSDVEGIINNLESKSIAIKDIN